MSKYQNGILWIGVLLVAVYLFTDKTFKALIFTGGMSSSNSGTGGPPALGTIGGEINQGVQTITSNLPSQNSTGTGGIRIVAHAL